MATENSGTGKEELVKEEILSEAQKLFQKYGLKKTTMDDIALASGKAKSTLYHYFKNKEEVIEEVFWMEIINLRKDVKRKVEKQEHMADKIKVYVLEFYREIFKRANLFRIMKQVRAESGKRSDSEYFIKIMAYEQSFITRILEDGFDAGEYKNVKRDDIPWIAEVLLSAFYGTVLYTFEKEGFLDEDHVSRSIDYFIPLLFA